jgi:dynein heavy chain
MFTTWLNTTWADTKADDLLTETQSLLSQVRKLPRETREWHVYMALQNDVKNMAVSLPLVHDLHSPGMRDRHWKALMVVTGKHLDKGADFRLQDVLAMKLHDHVEGVQ